MNVEKELLPKIIEALRTGPKSVKNINTHLYGAKKFKDRKRTSAQIFITLKMLMKRKKVRKKELGNKYELI